VEQRGAPATSTTNGTDHAAVADGNVGRREQVQQQPAGTVVGAGAVVGAEARWLAGAAAASGGGGSTAQRAASGVAREQPRGLQVYRVGGANPSFPKPPGLKKFKNFENPNGNGRSGKFPNGGIFRWY